MKVSIKKTEVYASMMGGGSAGKPHTPSLYL
jgi:hypothetical protein